MGPSPAQRLIPIRTEFLQTGMYVAELDRSWLHSPFAGHGLRITSPEQIEQLRQCCAYVYVDPGLSDTPPGERQSGRPARIRRNATAPSIAAARRVVADTLERAGRLVRNARRHAMVDVTEVETCAAAIAEQVIDEREALHWVLRNGDQGSFFSRRAVGTAAVAATLGWQIGLDRPSLHAVAAGGMLLDLGKIAVPVPILAKPYALQEAEHAYVRRHVERGLELVAGRDLPVRAVEMIEGHHERMDGGGYPHGLRGTQIPLFARIAAIADAYDAMTLNRRYAAAMSPHAALRQLDGLRAEKFDAALVGELIQVLGIYPVGTVVELADGCLGVVCGLRPRHPLQPRVLVTHDAARHALGPRLAAAADGVEIVRSLPPHVVSNETAQLEAALRDLSPAAA